MALTKSLLFSIILTIIATTCWEVFWRTEGYVPTLNDEKALWSIERDKLKDASKDDVVIIGASRAYFDIQVKDWEATTGKAPLQLACTGSSPLPLFHDIVHNSNFNGTVIMGVAPQVFFSPENPKSFAWERPLSRIKYFENETYAQKLNFLLSIPLQRNLVFMSADEEEWTDDLDLKALLSRIKIGNRNKSPNFPPFNNFGDVSIPRNIAVLKRTETDSVFAQTIIDVWNFEPEQKDDKKDVEKKKVKEETKKDTIKVKDKPKWPDNKTTLAYFLKDLKPFKNRGGNVILVRLPSNGLLRTNETKDVPRERYWDTLVKASNLPSYHFEDYPEFKDLVCPEESHLSLRDAEYFTKTFAKILMKDQLINKPLIK